MTYFVIATIHIYSKKIHEHRKMTPNMFREANPHLVNRVFDEGKSIFNYELSWEQLSRGIAAHLTGRYFPSDLETTPVYKCPKNNIENAVEQPATNAGQNR